jgi:hypothetical protein
MNKINNKKDTIKTKKIYKSPVILTYGTIENLTKNINGNSKTRDQQGTGNVKTS